jgi:hypothetical protein
MSNSKNIPFYPTAQYTQGIYPSGHTIGASLMDVVAIEVLKTLLKNDESQIEEDIADAFMIAKMFLIEREKHL